MKKATNIPKFEEDMAEYCDKRDEMIGFYREIGTLIDFEIRNGYESYDALKREL